MIAQFITLNAETIALCLARPNFATQPEVTASLPTDIAWHPIAKEESRRVFAGAARYQQKYRTTLRTAADATEFRMWLNRLRDELVAVPLWADRCVITADIAAGATFIPLHDHPARSGFEWIICAADFSAFEIVVIASVSASSVAPAPGAVANAWPAGSLMFPLMFGRLTERPELTSTTPERASCDLTFKENSVFARRLNPYAGSGITLVGGNISNLSALPLWDIEPNWTRVLDRTEVQIIYQLLGFGRVETARVYNQPVMRGLEFEIYARSRDEIARAESYFFDRRGTTRPLMVPTFRDDLRLTADVAIGDGTIPIEPSAFVDPTRPENAGDIYIALIDGNGIDPHKLSGDDSTNLATLIPLSLAHTMDQTRVSHLLLSRFVESKLDWQYHSDGKASCKVKFMELSHDYVAGGPAALKEPVYLFRFTNQLPTPQISRFTSYENQFATNTGEVFTPADFSWQDIETSLDLGDSAEIDSAPFIGNPLAEFFPFVIEGLLAVDILEADAANPTAAPKLLFSGEVAEFDPKEFKAKCDLGRILNDVKFPAFYLSTMDNLGVFEGPQALALASWKITGAISGSPLNTTTIAVASAAALAKPVDYFAMGWMETGAGANFERRAIIKSTAVAGGVQLVLDRPLLKAGASQSVDLYPGYDGDIETRATRFGDRGGFGGHPYTPDTPPNIKVLKAKQTPGGKKSGGGG